MLLKKRLLAAVLAGIVTVGVMSGCKKDDAKATPTPTSAPTATVKPADATQTPAEATQTPDNNGEQGSTEVDPFAGYDRNVPLVISNSTPEGKFSVFFYETAYDANIIDLTLLGLGGSTRKLEFIYNGIEGEYHDYEGTSYFYQTTSNVEITEDPNDEFYDVDGKKIGSTTYTFTIRDDLKYSDGNPVTIDDVLFSYYVYLDPDYNGMGSMYTVPIVGMEEYYYGMNYSTYDKYAALWNKIIGAEKGNTDFSKWSKEDSDLVWAAFDQAANEYIANLNAAIIGRYGKNYAPYVDTDLDTLSDEANAGLRTLFTMWVWGFGDYTAMDEETEVLDANGDVVMQQAMEEELDAEGNAVLDENGEPVMKPAVTEVLDEDGNPVLDADGNPVTEPVMEPVMELLPLEERGIFAAAETGKIYDTKKGEYPTIEDFTENIARRYDYAADYTVAGLMFGWGEEAYGAAQSPVKDLQKAFIDLKAATDPDAGEEAFVITGINKINDYQISVKVRGFQVEVERELTVSYMPHYYYGDLNQWDPANNKFGHPKGDLNIVREKTSQPLGAGPYKFIKYEDKVAYFEANPYYYRGEPAIKYVQLRDITMGDEVNALIAGTVDNSDPSFSAKIVKQIKDENSNGELQGNKIHTVAVDNNGYGYVTVSALNVKVGNDASSEASKNLRKGIATVIAAYRELSVGSYYQERASVINYPISTVSWASPSKTDQGYKVCYSLDVNGNPIYSDSMSDDEKTAAALNAAIEFFKAAGYTWDDGQKKFTAAPAGAKFDYEFALTAQGTDDHPAFVLVTEVCKALNSIGFNVQMWNPSDSNDVFTKMRKGGLEIGFAAYGGGGVEPAFSFKQYYDSTQIPGKPGSSGQNHYGIDSPRIDEICSMVLTIRDRDSRRPLYLEVYDIIFDWAVQVPVYQRMNCQVYSPERINISTFQGDVTPFWGSMAYIEQIRMNAANQ